MAGSRRQRADPAGRLSWGRVHAAARLRVQERQCRVVPESTAKCTLRQCTCSVLPWAVVLALARAQPVTAARAGRGAMRLGRIRPSLQVLKPRSYWFLGCCFLADRRVRRRAMPYTNSRGSLGHIVCSPSLRTLPSHRFLDELALPTRLVVRCSLGCEVSNCIPESARHSFVGGGCACSWCSRWPCAVCWSCDIDLLTHFTIRTSRALAHS